MSITELKIKLLREGVCKKRGKREGFVVALDAEDGMRVAEILRVVFARNRPLQLVGERPLEAQRRAVAEIFPIAAVRVFPIEFVAGAEKSLVFFEEPVPGR